MFTPWMPLEPVAVLLVASAELYTGED
jgi:hypothetical protein